MNDSLESKSTEQKRKWILRTTMLFGEYAHCVYDEQGQIVAQSLSKRHAVLTALTIAARRDVAVFVVDSTGRPREEPCTQSLTAERP